jgi:hypothetical protein
MLQSVKSEYFCYCYFCSQKSKFCYAIAFAILRTRLKTCTYFVISRCKFLFWGFACPRGRLPRVTPIRSAWDLRETMWHWYSFFSEYFALLLSILFHQYDTVRHTIDFIWSEQLTALFHKSPFSIFSITFSDLLISQRVIEECNYRKSDRILN